MSELEALLFACVVTGIVITIGIYKTLMFLLYPLIKNLNK